MDTRDGTIHEMEEVVKKFMDASPAERQMEMGFFKPMVIPPTEQQLKRKPPKIERNELCPCGSGKKFKNCCLKKKPLKRGIRVGRFGKKGF